MDIKQFTKKLEKAKKTFIHSGNYNLKIRRYKDNPCLIEILREREEKICRYCKREFEKEESLVIYFYKPQLDLTIFESSLLFMLFKLNEIPVDYARFHKCKAGEEFINNIKEVKGGNS